MKRIELGLLVSLAFLVVSGSAFAGDFVLQKDGRWLVSQPTQNPPLREDYDSSLVTVLDENYDKLIYTVKLAGGRGQRQEADMDKIQEVFYWPKPAAWVEGAAAMANGELDAALQAFSGLAKDKQNRNWVRMYSYANVATIHEARSDWQAAIDAWEALNADSDFKKSRLLPKALIQIGLDYLNLNDAAAAADSFKKLEKVPGLPSGQMMLARYYVIFIKQKQGEATGNSALLNQALADYRKLLDDTQNDPDLKEVAVRARLGIGACLVQLGKYDEALEFFRKIADASDDKVVLGGAFNGLGQCYYKQNKWMEALKAFLRTEILYSEDNPEQEAMALFFSGKCFLFLHGKGVGGDAYKQRARAQFTMCMNKYAGTNWAAQSKEARDAIR